MKYLFFVAALFTIATQNSHASGLDLTLIYGSRYVGLGGQQIAVSTDAYSPFYNAAGLAWIDKSSFAVGYSNLMTQYGAPIGAADNQRNSTWGLAPLFYLGGAYKLTDRVSLGLGIYPTALQGGKFTKVDYSADITDKEWSNRLVRIEFSPSAAVKVIGPLSVGLSYRLGYTQFDNASGNFLAGLYTDTTVSKWDAKGLKISAMIEDFENLSFALTYRFRQSMNLSGTTKYYSQFEGITSTPASLKTVSRIKIPAQIQAGLAYKIIPDKALVAFTYEYTQNDIIKSSSLNFTESGQSFTVPLNYRNGHTLHLGGEYRFGLGQENRYLSTQLGIAYDRKTTRKATPNPVLPPDDDFWGFAAGAQYHLNDHIFGLAANYGAYDSRTTSVDAQLTGSSFTGKYSITNIMVTADYQYKF